MRIFSWLLSFIRGERRRVADRLRPFAIAIAEDLFDKDFNQNGVVADARIELGKLLRALAPDVRQSIFDEYYNRDGLIRSDLIGVLPVRVLKKILAMARLVSALRAQGWPIPLPAILKQGYSLLDSVLQGAFEEGRKEQP